MTEIGKSIALPFKDWKKLGIGTLINAIPIVNFIGMGYAVACGESGMKKNHEMPEWKNWGSLFISGLLALILGLIYIIPLVIVAIVSLGSAVLTLVGQITTNPAAFNPLTALPMLGVGLFITCLVAILTGYILPAALLAYAERKHFGDAFNFGNVFRRAFSGSYFVAWLVMVIITGILTLIGMLLMNALQATVVLPWIVLGFITFVSTTMAMNAYGDAYSQQK